MSVLTQAYFYDEAAAFEALEGILWPNGPTCPLCGNADATKIGKLEGVRSKPSKKNPQGVVRHGLRKCYACRGQFTVRKGTIFEDSHLELHKWFQAAFLMCSSKKGVSANQLHRTLKCTLKTAWFVAHRLRETMRSGDLTPFGGFGTAVEVDETYIGRKKGAKVRPGGHHKMKVLTLVDRVTGQARSVVMNKITAASVAPILRANLAREARLMTDESQVYLKVGEEFAEHKFVNHSLDEYVRGDVSTNTVEGYFSIFKRGMKGVYQHCKEKHLHRYMAEFDFRYNNRAKLGVNDAERTTAALLGAVGKRLTYRDS